MAKNFRREERGGHDSCSSYRGNNRREIRDARRFKYSLSIQTYVEPETRK